MNRISMFLIFSSLTSSFFCYSQFRPDNSGGYIFSLRVDSSHNYVIGEQPNKVERTKYTFEERYQGMSSYTYTGEARSWSNVYVYNDSTLKLTKVFNLPLIIVYPVFDAMLSLKYEYYINRGIMSGITKHHIIYAVKTDKYNSNGIIDSDDPVYLFASKKDGTECRQITPDGMNVTSWRLIKEGKGILTTIQPDSNGDKRFLEDEVLYETELHSNISIIKSKPLNL